MLIDFVLIMLLVVIFWISLIIFGWDVDLDG